MRAYRIYISDSARLFVNNQAEAFGGNRIETRFADLLKPYKEAPSAEEIKARICAGLAEYEEENEDEWI